MQVSVPGRYQKPAPYSEQILTYSTALAFTGRSAACAPPTASRAAAEPSKRPLNFMLNLQVEAPVQIIVQRRLSYPRKDVGNQRILVTMVYLSEPPKTGR